MTAEAHQPATSRLPVITFWVAGATLATAPFLLLWSIIPGLVSLVLGVLAYRATRQASPREVARGSMALSLGAVAFLAGLGMLAIALIVSGTAIFTG